MRRWIARLGRGGGRGIADDGPSADQRDHVAALVDLGYEVYPTAANEYEVPVEMVGKVTMEEPFYEVRPLF